MEIVERKENPLLDRVELSFVWDHPGKPTPSLAEMIEASAKSEPGSDKKLVFVKNVNTRFGMSRTSGLAMIYGSPDSASIEPDYVIERHKTLNESESNEKKVEEPETEKSESEEETEANGEEGEA